MTTSKRSVRMAAPVPTNDPQDLGAMQSQLLLACDADSAQGARPDADEPAATTAASREAVFEADRLATRAQLSADSPRAGADERLLHDLIAGDIPVALSLQCAQEQLVRVLHEVLNDPGLAIAVSRVLREVVALSSAVTRRVEGSILAASSLRAQRRFFAAGPRP